MVPTCIKELCCFSRTGKTEGILDVIAVNVITIAKAYVLEFFIKS